ncbi:MAG: helix-turn-helix domain-containing protein [Bacteroidota bacterium]|jgi:excisionase family DNA binding protein
MNKNKTLKQVNESDYFTVDEAANELGIKTNAIRNYLYLGKLTTHKFKNLTLLDANEVNNWKSRQK